jgi:hypothetical protein
MSDAAVLPERVLLAEDVPSRFGGTRTRLVEGPRRLHPTTLALDDDGLDVARWLSRPVLPGAAPRGLALARRIDVTTAAQHPPSETQTLQAVWAAWCAALVARGCRRVQLLPRMAERAEALRVAAAAAGLDVGLLSLVPPQPLLLVDDSEVVSSVGWRTLTDASHAAMLAAGLAADVVAALLQLGGADAAEVWEKGFDDVARELFMQRVERALRRASSDGPQRAALSALLPALSVSTSKLAAVRALPDASPRAVALATTLRQRQEQQWQAWASTTIEFRAPASRATFWADRVPELQLAPGRVWVVGAPTSSTIGLLEALTAAGHVPGEPTASWLTGARDDEDAPPAVARPAAPVPKAVGGVRASGAVLVDVEPEPAPPVPEPARGTSTAVHEHAAIAVPSQARDVRVLVDGVVRPDLVAVAGAVRIPPTVRWGSIVVVACDDDVQESQ